MALEGTLKDFSLADIFQLIGLQRKTGVLTLRSKDDTVTVTFLDGKVVGADSLSHRLENRLGSVLIKSGLLTNDQRPRSSQLPRQAPSPQSSAMSDHCCHCRRRMPSPGVLPSRSIP